MNTIKVYGFLAEKIEGREIEIETEGKKVEELLREIEGKIDVKLFENGEVLPTLLVLINGREYKSLGLLDEELEGNEEIKLVPTFHGGNENLLYSSEKNDMASF